ncbi:hypothetical protein BH11MYX3_BH11MYX3_08060 [soil metagenome]
MRALKLARSKRAVPVSCGFNLLLPLRNIASVKHLLVLLALAAGCTEAPTDDDELALPSDGKADSYWSQVKMLGNLDYDTTVDVNYTRTPEYRAFTMAGAFDDVVDISVGSGTGHPVLAIYDANKTLLDSNHARRGSASLDAHISVSLAAGGTLYVVLYDLDRHAAHFDITATHASVCHPAICTSDQCGIVPDGCGANESCGDCLPTTTAPICTSYGKDCGRIYPPDSSVGIECGGCTNGTTCGGAGIADVCGVTPGHDWLTDLPHSDTGNWSGRATFTVLGITHSGGSGFDNTSSAITCTVSGIPGHGLPLVYCKGPRDGGWGSLRSDGTFVHDSRGVPGSDLDLVFAGTIEPHGRIRLTEYSESYYSPSIAHEWAFPCLLHTDPVRCTTTSSWTTSAVATLQRWSP